MRAVGAARSIRAGALALAVLALVAGTCRRNLAPTLPELSGDLSGWPGDTLHYAAVATDPEGRQLSYFFTWGDTCGGEWTPPAASGDTVLVRHVYSDSGAVVVRVRARDDADNLSEWSNPLEVSIGRRHPARPTMPAGPDSGYTSILHEFSTTAASPYGESLRIQFDWGDSTPPAWSLPVASGSAFVGVHGYAGRGTYEIRARSMDPGGWTTDWSVPRRFSVSSHPPYRPLAPLGPWDGERNATHSLSSLANDPDGNRVAIRFDWGDGDTSDWSGFVRSGDTATMGHAWSSFGTFEVKAQARDDQGAVSDWSPPQVFDVRPALRWRYRTLGRIWTSPALGPDGAVYFGSRDNNLDALNPDGSLRWRYLTDGRVLSSPAVGPDGTVYVGSDDNHLHAVNPDGTLKWRYRAEGDVESSPALGPDGTVYFGSQGSDRSLYALNPDGSLRWQYQTGGSVLSSPAVGPDGTIYVGSSDDHLHAITPEGKMKWSYLTGGNVRSSPAVGSDGTIYVGSGDNHLYAVNPNGTMRWSYRTDDYIRSSPAVGSDGTIYIGSNDSCLHAITPQGTTRWSYRTGDYIRSSPAVCADGTVLVGSDDDWLYAVNPDGTLQWRYRAETSVRSSPAVGPDGTVYFGTNGGYLHALAGDSPLANSPWPKFRHDNLNTGRSGGGR
ncbi:MAG: PQQ-binding-like beta-propeller repeat protein [bacterium]